MKGGYVDGFVLTIPKNKFNDYKKAAVLGGKVWMKHGALAYFECVADDLTQQVMGKDKTRAFKEVAKAKPTDEVWFSFIVYKNRKHRDQVNAKVMKDSAMNEMGTEMKDMPFDMNKMAYGGFRAVVNAMPAKKSR